MTTAKSITVAFTVFLFGSVCVTAQRAGFAGAYMSCEMACQAIQIRPNGTFQRLFDGDLYNDERTDGWWKKLGPNRLNAWSSKPDGDPKVIESKEERQNLLILVVDFAGALLPGAEISGVSDGKAFHCVTGNDGTCLVPRTDRFDLKWLKYNGVYMIKDPDSTVFRVELSYEQMRLDVIDDVWVIEGNFLYFEGEGKIDREYRLKRLSKERERELFPNSRDR